MWLSSAAPASTRSSPTPATISCRPHTVDELTSPTLAAVLEDPWRLDGPNDFPINRTADAAGISPGVTGDRWRLTLSGGTEDVELDRAALLALPQHTAVLPIACVEGWSTTQTWTGVRLRDLAVLAGASAVEGADVRSLEESGAFNTSALNAGQASHEDALLALRVNGADLSLDHGFPARVIVPAMPGVLNTKWVTAISFRSA